MGINEVISITYKYHIYLPIKITVIFSDASPTVFVKTIVYSPTSFSSTLVIVRVALLSLIVGIILFDFLTTLPLTNHSSFGGGVDVNLTSILTSSPCLTLYSFFSSIIFGAASIAEKIMLMLKSEN